MASKGRAEGLFPACCSEYANHDAHWPPPQAKTSALVHRFCNIGVDRKHHPD
jgi:hypothetical protein